MWKEGHMFSKQLADGLEFLRRFGNSEYTKQGDNRVPMDEGTEFFAWVNVTSGVVEAYFGQGSEQFKRWRDWIDIFNTQSSRENWHHHIRDGVRMISVFEREYILRSLLNKDSHPMTELEKILIENLKESLSKLQTYLIWGIGAALSFLLLSVSNLGTATVAIPLPGALTTVNTTFARLIALAIAWFAGALATYTYERTVRIVSKMKSSPEVVRAILSYPSVVTEIYPGVRLMAAIIPAAFILFGFISVWNNIETGFMGRVFLMFFALIPYFTLAVELITLPLPIDRPILRSETNKK
jgi:hypothetical protein